MTVRKADDQMETGKKALGLCHQMTSERVASLIKENESLTSTEKRQLVQLLQKYADKLTTKSETCRVLNIISEFIFGSHYCSALSNGLICHRVGRGSSLFVQCSLGLEQREDTCVYMVSNVDDLTI